MHMHLSHPRTTLAFILLLSNSISFCMMTRSNHEYTQAKTNYYMQTIYSSTTNLNWKACKKALYELILENPHALVAEFDKRNSHLRTMCEHPHTISDHVKILATFCALGAIPGMYGLYYSYENPLTLDGVGIGVTSAVWLQMLRCYYITNKECIEKNQTDFARLIYKVVKQARKCLK